MERRSTRKPTRQHLDAEDVIAGRGRPPATRELIELIREVNPTGRELAPKEMARRYAQKSRLQSLLIRRCADDLAVAAAAAEPGVVSLHHRLLGASACHALVCELDEDARAWVQFRLDVEASGGAPAETRRAERCVALPGLPDGGGDVDLDAADLLRAGQDAADAYDYELARAHLLQALDRPDAGAEVAVALLSLLVDHLAADQEALALEDRLPAQARSRPEVRQLLALAAARTADRGRALGLLKLPQAARAAEVFLALARAALEAGDLPAAAADLAQVRARDPAHHELRGLAESLAARRAAERRPMEAELARLFGEGRLDDAEICGRQILSRWPDSEAGRRACRSIEEIRRAAAAQRLVHAAGEALDEGELGQARALIEQARAAGAPGELTAEVQQRVDDAAEAERARAERAALDRAVALLGEVDREPGLLAYLALSPRQRAQTRPRVPLPLLGWLSEIAVQPASGARARAALSAVAALERAGAIVAAAPQAALDLLAAQGKILHGVSRSVEIAREGQLRLDVLRREVACRGLDAARASFENGDLARAEALLEDVAIGDLPERDGALAEELEAMLARAREQRRLVTQLERYRRDGAILVARDQAAALGARAEGDEIARWAAVKDELDDEIGRVFRRRVDTAPLPFTSLRELDQDIRAGVWRALLPGGRELLLVQTHGVWVFLRVVDLASWTIRARVLLRTPQPVNAALVELGSDRLLVVGKRGAVLGLQAPAWTVQLWGERVGIASPEETFDHVAMVPNTVFLWVALRPSGDRRWIVRVIDLRSGRMVRELRETVDQLRLRAVPGLGEPLMALVTFGEDALHLYDPQGQRIERGKHALTANVDGIVAAPGGDRLLVLTGSRREADERKCTPSGWTVIVPGGAPAPEQSLAFLGEVAIGAVTDSDSGLTYLRCEDHDSGRRLLGVRLTASEPPALEVSFDADIPGRNMLLEAGGGGPVTMLTSHEDGVDVAELGAAPPAYRPGPLAGRMRLGRLIGFGTLCHRATGTRGAAIQALAATMRGEARPARVRRFEAAKREGHPDRLVALGFALRQLDEPRDAAEVITWTLQRHPAHPEIRLQQARFAANDRQWSQVRDLLADLDVSALDEGSAQHIHHLLGVALLFLDRHAEALPLLRRGAAYAGGRCELDVHLALAIPLADEATAPEAASWTPDQVFLREILRAVTTADACLAQGDAAGALRALDCLAVAEAQEVQSLARRAEATLLLGDTSEARRFETAFALASFCGAHAEKARWYRQELPLPGGMWAPARLDALAERASRWLDTTLGEAWPMPVGGL